MQKKLILTIGIILLLAIPIFAFIQEVQDKIDKCTQITGNNQICAIVFMNPGHNPNVCDNVDDYLKGACVVVRDELLKEKDIDGDGILDDVDECPTEDSRGFDADLDGCIDDINSLLTLTGSLDIDPAIINSLSSKLDNALADLNKGNKISAINKLNALINEIKAQKGKKISNEDADALIAMAGNVIVQIV